MAAAAGTHTDEQLVALAVRGTARLLHNATNDTNTDGKPWAEVHRSVA
jgi:hypothetical protein